MTQVTVEVEVDIDKFSDFDIKQEAVARDLIHDPDAHHVLLEKLYYALRDENLDEAIKIVNPLLDEVLGRQI